MQPLWSVQKASTNLHFFFLLSALFLSPSLPLFLAISNPSLSLPTLYTCIILCTSVRQSSTKPSHSPFVNALFELFLWLVMSFMKWYLSDMKARNMWPLWPFPVNLSSKLFELNHSPYRTYTYRRSYHIQSHALYSFVGLLLYSVLGRSMITL